MSLGQILILSAVTTLLAVLPAARWRNLILMTVSILCIFWLQPALTIRHFDFWLPTVAIGISVLIWAASREQITAPGQDDWITLGIIGFMIIAITGLRYLGPLCCLTPTRPPGMLSAISIIAGFGIVAFIVYRTPRVSSKLLILALILVLIVLKYPPFSQYFSSILRRFTGQDPALASPIEIQWLGYSYLAFRLIHLLREYQTGRLRSVSLDKLVVYALFFPTLVAGPIDRYPRFQRDFEAGNESRLENYISGIQRILLGIFKKFALADSLALVALNPINALQVREGAWMWVILYAYSLRIYLDFAGYTDIALGLGRMLGFSLPENFQTPYLKTDLTAFWNSWHITLAQWFRAYLFNPLTRFLRARPEQFPVWLIILLGQICTMGLIGLWHGISWNFLIWGIWHAAGLFIHNRWVQWWRTHSGQRIFHFVPDQLKSIAGWALTFHFVTLGWVWFALPDLTTAWVIFRRLFLIG